VPKPSQSGLSQMFFISFFSVLSLSKPFGIPLRNVFPHIILIILLPAFIKLLWKVVLPFRPTSRKRDGDSTTKLRQQDVGAGSDQRDERRARFKVHHSEAQCFAYFEALWRAFSVISKAKVETWQANCNNLSPAQIPVPFRDPELPNSQSRKDTANTYTSYFRSHFSQQTSRLSRGAEHSFTNNILLDQCSDPSFHSTFCFPFTTKEFTTAISKLSTSTAWGPDLIAYPLLTHLLSSAQQHLLFIFNWSWSSHTFFFCWKPTTIIPIHKPADSPASFCPIFLIPHIFKLFEHLVLNRHCYYLESKNLISPIQAGFRPGRSTTDQVLLLSQSIRDDFQKKRLPD